MYLPNHFRVENIELMVEVAQQNPFGLLLSNGEDGYPEATHIPVLVSDKLETAMFHIAKANPQSAALIANKKAKVVFSGPHAFIHPDFYVEPGQVPTWGYISLEISGAIEILEEEQAILHVLEMSQNFGAVVSETEAKRIIKGTVCFKMKVESRKGKWKVGQNKKDSDRISAAKHLLNSKDPMEQSLGHWYQSPPERH